MKSRVEFKISDDSGFMGLVNADAYESFIDSKWDFELLKKRIVTEMNKNHILFWSTGREDFWKVKWIINPNELTGKPFRSGEALIEVTNNRLYLVNYETISMAAQFNHVRLPEKHLDDLYLEIPNGLYIVQFSQIVDPGNYNERGELDFELYLELVEDPNEYYPNDFGNIFWNPY